MSESEESQSRTAIVDPVEFLEQLSEVQYQLREDFERLAAAVTPLLSKQYCPTSAGSSRLRTSRSTSRRASSTP
jgi:hypothetical protein